MQLGSKWVMKYDVVIMIWVVVLLVVLLIRAC